VGVNSMNDGVQRGTQSTNAATTALLQQREQDIQVEDYICCYGETAVKPLFRIINWFLQQDADHPSVQNRFIQVTGKPSIDHSRFQIGEWRVRDDFVVNVGLGVDAPDYKQQKAAQLIQIMQMFNQAMSGTMLPNLLKNMYEGFRDQVDALGYDPDTHLMSRDEFEQFFQQLLQQHQQQQQQAQNDPMKQLQMRGIQAEVAEKEAKAKQAEAAAQKSLAEAKKAEVETMIAMAQLQSGQLQDAKTIIWWNT